MTDLAPLFEWNLWANRTTFAALESGSPPPRSVNAFHHVLSAELAWLRRMPDAQPSTEQLWIDATVARCRELLEVTSPALASLAAGWDQQALETTFTYRNRSGREFTDRRSTVLQHLALHSSQYRGEALGLLAAAGITPPDVDYIFWLRKR